MPSQKIGSLSADLDLKTDKFTAAVKTAGDQLASGQARMNRSLGLINKQFNDLQRTVETAKGKLIGFASVYFSAGFIKSAIDMGDHINDLSKQTGVSVETLSKLSLAANQSGTDLDSVAQSINKMQKNISEGTDIFGQLGIKLSDIKKLSPEEQFLTIAEQISKLGDDSDRTRALMDIFGKSGASLAPLFSEGAEGIRNAMERAKELNLVLSPEQAAKMDAYNDHVAELTAKLRILAVDGFEFAYDKAIKFNEFVEGVSKITRASDFRIPVDELSGQEEILRRRAFLVERITKLQKAFNDEQDPAVYNKYKQELENLNKQLEQTSSSVTFYSPISPPKSQGKINFQPPALKGLSDAQKQQNQELKEAQKIYDDTRTAAEKYSAEVNKLDNFLMSGEISQDTYNRALKKASDEYEKATEKNNELKDAAKDLGLTFTSAFEDAVVKGEKLRTVLASLAQDVAKIALRRTVTEPLNDFITGTLKTAFNFGGARANGGSVFAGMSYDVGEFGRERFVPNINGSIVPYDQIAENNGGLTVHNTFNMTQGGSGRGVNDAALLEQVAKVAENSVRMVYAEETRNQMRTGGLFNPV